MLLSRAQLWLSYLGSFPRNHKDAASPTTPHSQINIFKQEERRRGFISALFSCMCFLVKLKVKSVSEIPTEDITYLILTQTVSLSQNYLRERVQETKIAVLYQSWFIPTFWECFSNRCLIHISFCWQEIRRVTTVKWAASSICHKVILCIRPILFKIIRAATRLCLAHVVSVTMQDVGIHWTINAILIRPLTWCPIVLEDLAAIT